MPASSRCPLATYAGHRLLSSSGLATSSGSSEYDLDGNRTKRVEGGSTTTFSYDRADQTREQVIGGTTRTFTYDPYGNLLQTADTTSALTTYAYDEASRLTGITPPARGAITFTMDALDRHQDRSVGGVTADTNSYLDATETAWQTGQGTPTSALLDVDGSRLAGQDRQHGQLAPVRPPRLCRGPLPSRHEQPLRRLPLRRLGPAGRVGRDRGQPVALPGPS